jgi:hypothetical protein
LYFRNGSIEVEFNLYIIALNVIQANMSLSTLDSSLKNNNQSLGSFQVIVDSFEVVSVEKLLVVEEVSSVTVVGSIVVVVEDISRFPVVSGGMVVMAGTAGSFSTLTTSKLSTIT